jgi:hypothetical protein
MIRICAVIRPGHILGTALAAALKKCSALGDEKRNMFFLWKRGTFARECWNKS